MAPVLYKWLLIPAFLVLVSFSGKRTFETGMQQNTDASIGLPGTRTFHPFYMAVTEINQNAQEKTLEIICKLFADDFEETLKKNFKTNVDLSSGKDKAVIDQYISTYFGKHFSMSVDGRPVKLTYVGFEKDKNSAYCYFQVDNVVQVKKLDVQNTLLHDFTDGQTNIVHAHISGKRQSTKLDYPAKVASFIF